MLTNLVKYSNSDLNGEFVHTYGEIQTYLVLLFFTFSYVLIDNGLQLAGAEIRYYMNIRRELLEKLKNKSVGADETLDNNRYTNFKSKFFE